MSLMNLVVGAGIGFLLLSTVYDTMFNNKIRTLPVGLSLIAIGLLIVPRIV